MDVAESLQIEGTIRIPLLGEVAAGLPLDVYSVEETLDVPESLWGRRKVFALRVRGSSMVEAGIHDGDYLIVEPRVHADDGRTVVAEVDGRVTVKKLHRQGGGTVRLQPANAEMLPLVVPGENVRILGVVAGILRKYGFGRSEGTEKRAPEPAARRRPRDPETFDLTLNAIDRQIGRWEVALREVRRRPRASMVVVRMEEMDRELRALREWYGRTGKPGLRQSILGEARRLMRRMESYARRHQLPVPDPTRP